MNEYEIKLKLDRTQLASYLGGKSSRLLGESVQLIADELARLGTPRVIDRSVLRSILAELDGRLLYDPIDMKTEDGEPVPGDLVLLPIDGLHISKEAALNAAALDWYRVSTGYEWGASVYYMASKAELEEAGIDVTFLQERTDNNINFDLYSDIAITKVPHANKRFSRYDGLFVAV